MNILRFAKAAARRVLRRRPFHPTLEMLVPIELSVKPDSKPRLNILVPTLNPEHVFGGITTALRFYEALGTQTGMECRMIVTDEQTLPEYVRNYPEYTLCEGAKKFPAAKQVVPCFPRAGKVLPVRSGDIFIATAWWTAVLGDRILAEIEKQTGSATPLLYFIQDYEPYFYAWSSFSAMAESSYHLNREVLAVFNSHELRDYFRLHGYSFTREFCFDPVLNASLKKALTQHPPKEKSRKILVYGRPSVSRNCIELVLDGLTQWAKTAKDPERWELFSAGESFPDIHLTPQCTLHSVGKLSIEEYARLMSETYAGISLMVSPHPSYPPLEMSTFGVKTITNTYENKDLSGFHENIVSLSNITPENIGNTLAAITDNYAPDRFVLATDTPYFQNDFSFDAICREIGPLLLPAEKKTTGE